MMKCRIMRHSSGCSIVAKYPFGVSGPKRSNEMLQMANCMNMILLIIMWIIFVSSPVP